MSILTYKTEKGYEFWIENQLSFDRNYIGVYIFTLN